MRIVPVLDLMAGRVVRGIAGRREEYRPVESRLVGSAEPVEVARAFRDKLGLSELYVADLDAIAGGEPAWSTYAQLRSEGMRLLVDAGLRDLVQAARLAEAGVEGIVAGLETLSGPQVLGELVRHLGPQRILFSLDLKAGEPLAARDWGLGSKEAQTPTSIPPRESLAPTSQPLAPSPPPLASAHQIALQALTTGVRRMIVLDLSRVGTGTGTGTEELCRWLRDRCPDLELIAGGGVRGIDDLSRLAGAGVDAALVASALHDGRIGRQDLEAIGAVSR